MSRIGVEIVDYVTHFGYVDRRRDVVRRLAPGWAQLLRAEGFDSIYDPVALAMLHTLIDGYGVASFG